MNRPRAEMAAAWSWRCGKAAGSEQILTINGLSKITIHEFMIQKMKTKISDFSLTQKTSQVDRNFLKKTNDPHTLHYYFRATQETKN
jgi:hypothetical protein